MGCQKAPDRPTATTITESELFQDPDHPILAKFENPPDDRETLTADPDLSGNWTNGNGNEQTWSTVEKGRYEVATRRADGSMNRAEINVFRIDGELFSAFKDPSPSIDPPKRPLVVYCKILARPDGIEIRPFDVGQLTSYLVSHPEGQAFHIDGGDLVVTSEPDRVHSFFRTLAGTEKLWLDKYEVLTRKR